MYAALVTGLGRAGDLHISTAPYSSRLIYFRSFYIQKEEILRGVRETTPVRRVSLGGER
jgi:hypothetical protein